MHGTTNIKFEVSSN